MRRVAVTGLGAVSPIGNDARSTWESAVAGRSGIDFIQAFDTSEFPVRVAAEVKDFDAAATEAAADARLEGAYEPARVGVLFGTAIGGISVLAEQHEILRERGNSR